MIPKLLTIKGLYSYQTEQTVNFEELTRGNLFGIFGNVGAGKSSILEAIMLALYGEVERMGKSGRNYNIMNLRSDDLFILFDFEIDGKLYRSKVTGSRNSKRFNDVKVKSPAFFEFIENEYKPIDIETAESLIGLKSEDFKKTIIIPQGTFQDFLQLGDTDRARMMRELFGLERYELEPKVKVLQEQNDNNIKNYHGQLTIIGEVNSEGIENKKLELNDLQNIINSFQIEVEQKRKTENELKQLKTDFELRQNIQERHTELLTHDAHFSLLEKQINDYEKAVLTFKHLIENRQKLAADWQKNDAELKSKRQKFDKNQILWQQLNQSRQELTPQYEQREAFKKQAEEIKKIIDIQQTQTILSKSETRLLKGQTFLNEKIKTLEFEKTKAADIEKQRIDLRTNQPNLTELNVVKDWFTTSFNIQKEITRLETDRKTVDEKLAAMYQTKTVIVWKDLPPLNIHLTNETRIADVIAQVKAKILALKSDNENILHEQLHLKTSEKLETWATALSEGDPCPLCGATHHPSVMQISEVRLTLKNLEQLLTQNKKNLKTLENIDNQLITLNTNYNNENEERQKLNLILADEKQRLEAHNQKFVWSSFSPTDYNAVESALRAAAEFDSRMHKLEEALRSINKNKENAENDIERFRKEISSIQSEMAAKQSAISVLKAQIEILDFEKYLSNSEAELRQWVEILEQQYITIEKEFQILEIKIQNAQSEGQILRGGIEALASAQTDLEMVQSRRAAELTEQLKATYFENIEHVERILATNMNVAQERQRLNEFNNQKLLIAARLTELNEKLQGKEYSTELHNALIIDIQNLEKQIQVHNQKIGELKRDLIDMATRLKQRQQIEKQLVECNYRAENLRILRGLFQRSGFVKYASSVFLQSIINSANERFMKLTRQQLRLEINENNSFIVRDMLNDGQFRDVRTLSGGQTFQAALSLALALSDHIQSRNQARQNFFFLDEGFGSLDRESLETVFDTLKALRKENRIVGVISHVEDMRLEIERYLNVRLSDTSGSIVDLIIG